MNRRNFISSMVTLPVIPMIGNASLKKSDKYEDPNYGNWFKTPNSKFTMREIEMLCREMGWHHIEIFDKKYDSQTPPYYSFSPGVGYFTAWNGKQYHTINTFRMQWFDFSAWNTVLKNELREVLKCDISTRYGNPKREYYLYDVVLIDVEPYDVIGWCKLLKEEPTEEALQSQGKPIGKLIYYHLGIDKQTENPWR